MLLFAACSLGVLAARAAGGQGMMDFLRSPSAAHYGENLRYLSPLVADIIKHESIPRLLPAALATGGAAAGAGALAYLGSR